MFKPIKTLNAADCVVNQIKEMIINGELREGDKLPPELDLVKSLGVSRSALREALKSLENMGVLESRQGNGHYICNHIAEKISDSLSMALVFDNHALKDVTQMRQIFELATLKDIIKTNNEGAIQKLLAFIPRFEAAETREEIGDLDTDFHMELISFLQNSLLQFLYLSVFTVYRESTIYSNHFGWKTQSLEHIREYQLDILRAIQTRDMQVIEAALEHHYYYKNPEQTGLMDAKSQENERPDNKK